MLLKSAKGRLCLVSGICMAVALGCGTGVGDPCVPERIPDNGFDETEAYIETSSVQCETRVCGVFEFVGDPRMQDQRLVENGVYCTCRCEAPEEDIAVCECPADFECKEIFDIGGSGIQGGYCVKRDR